MTMTRAPALVLLAVLLAPLVQAQSPEVAPAEGFWYDPERPGTGFSLELRGQTVALAFYHFVSGSGEPTWHLAVGALEGGVMVASLQAFRNGSCITCQPFREADVLPPDGSVHLTFLSAREALLRVDDGAEARVVALPYGVPYAATAGEAADVPLPDLRGTWLLGSPESHSPYLSLQLDAMQQDTAANVVAFTGTAVGIPHGPATVECTDAPPECRLSIDDQNANDLEAVFAIGDIDEERATGHATGGSATGRALVAWRVADAEGQP